MSLKNFKTCLRYPGGKSKAIDKMFKYLPCMNSYTEYREPFLGGGSVAIAMAKRNPHLNIWVNDLYFSLYNFYVTVKNDGDNLYNELINLKRENSTVDKARELSSSCRIRLNDPAVSNFDKAICFYVLNKCSFSGLTETGSSFSADASDGCFTLNNIENIKYMSRLMQNWKLTNQSYETILENPDENTFVYLDPPYDIKDVLYGKSGSMHKGFDHNLFADRCNNSSMHMMISYNNDQYVRDRFPESDWKYSVFDLTYTMVSKGDYLKNQKDRKELLLTNYPLENNSNLDDFF